MADKILLTPNRDYVRRFNGPTGQLGRSQLFEFVAAPMGIDDIKERFFGPTLSTFLWTVNNTNSGTSPAIVAGQVGGVCRFTTGTTIGGSSTLSGGLNWQGQINAIIWAKVKLSAITNAKVEVGFADGIATTYSGIVATKATPTFNATDGVCWIVDTNDNGNWEGEGVQNGTAATKMTPGSAITPVAATYEWLGVALIGANATFMHADQTGKVDFMSSPMVNAVTSTVNLAPYLTAITRDTTSKNVDFDDIIVYQRKTTGG